MPRSDQVVNPGRYTVNPRTAIFVRRGVDYLLIKGSSTKGWWAGRYNCLGGHVERGEDLLSAARRELLEEAGIKADLWLCGTVNVDAGKIGICLFVFLGENPTGEIEPSDEGVVEWVAYDRIADLPVVEDLPILLRKLHGMQRGDAPFAARSFYDPQEKLTVVFSE